MEGRGECGVWGWGDTKLGPLPTALLNSTFIQAFELDDYHAASPIHSSAAILPALCALAQHIRTIMPNAPPITSADFLLAATIGYELGPRFGLAFHGSAILSRGWHSGAVFGPGAVALACSKLLGLTATQMEDAVGIACTQACGLMSAQYGAMVKRMQHGFASRNGLFAALMAKHGYTGIRSVLEVPYGGYVAAFGNGAETDVGAITRDLGTRWEVGNVVVKSYASLAATNATVDCVRQIQEQNPGALKYLDEVREIAVQMADAAFKKGGWAPERPVDSTSAQMSAAYAAASQIVDGHVLAAQFSPAALDRDGVWDWVAKIRCTHNPEYDKSEDMVYTQRMTVSFKDENRRQVEVLVPVAQGIDPLLTNEEIDEKSNALTQVVLAIETRDAIKEQVLNLEDAGDFHTLLSLLSKQTAKLPGF